MHDDRVSRLVLDLGQVAGLMPEAIDLIAEFGGDLHSGGGWMRLANVSTTVRNALTTTNLPYRFDIRSTLGEAIA
ncbi:STAS domain-containing protein [Lignipirellula cremea]|nr:hypothetical protein [Lignipirellula cremea]